MKIRNKLTLQSTIIIAIILALFGVAIYYAYAKFREDEFFERLRKQAISKAKLLLDSKIQAEVLQAIYKNAPNSLFQEEEAIYDTGFHLIYHDDEGVDFVKENKAMIDEIRLKKEILFLQENRQVVGFSYIDNGKEYIITAAAYDEYGLSRLQRLKYIILITFLISTLIVFAASRFFARQALKPVSDMVNKVADITVTNLDQRVDEGNRTDEIAELAITFNQMLDRLEQSFEAQKQFVSNISHELRTPLSGVIGELQLAKEKERTNDEYKQVLDLVLHDARKMAKLSNNLLNLAKASYNPTEIAFAEIRLDELLVDARHEVLKANPFYHITVQFDKEIEEGASVSVNGNEYLLKVAFINLMENGCKFSENKTCEVTISYRHDKTILQFKDKGVGIPEEELPYIFKSFFRGSNKKYADGNGIGLTLTQKIIYLHKGAIYVASANKQGTTFTIELSHL